LRQVLLLGSVPLSDSKQVFETVAKILNGSVKRIPDGETGPRSFWMRWQGAVFSDNPQFELAKTTSTTDTQGYTYQHYRVRDDVDPAALRIGPLGYARHAKSSYEMFSQLRQAGVIARDLRFQVCMATPLAHLWAYVDPEHQPVVEQPLLAGFAIEIEEILAVVPAAELAIQWDMPHDILSIEGNRKLHVDVQPCRSAAALVPPGRKDSGGGRAGISLLLRRQRRQAQHRAARHRGDGALRQ
jgi:hypothetical protein